MTVKKPQLRAPKRLKIATRRWWLDVTARWQLEEHHVWLLTLAGEAWDRGQDARALVTKERLTAAPRDGQKLHPAVRIESDCRLAFARLLRELDLDLDPPAEAKRPAPLRSIG